MTFKPFDPLRPFDPNDQSDIRQFGGESHPCHRLKVRSTNENAQVEVDTNRFGRLIISVCACQQPFIRQAATQAEINAESLRNSEPELWTRMGKAWDDWIMSLPETERLFIE